MSSEKYIGLDVATGWSEPVPGRDLHPLKPSAFSRRTITSTIGTRAPRNSIPL
jgi:hypothetical protein